MACPLSGASHASGWPPAECVNHFASALGTASDILRVQVPSLSRSVQAGSESCGRHGNVGSEAWTAVMWGVGLSHEILTIAEAETVLIVESSMQAIDKARWPHSTGVEGHITDERISLEPRKFRQGLRLVTEGGVRQGTTGV